MITEALLDKIKALISGYKQPAHPLYGKSDKEVAGVIKSMVSRYLIESKQQILKEAGSSSGFPNVRWGDRLTSTKSGRPSKDWANGVINPELIKDISNAAKQSGIEVTITHSRTGHSKTTSSGYISRHWNGTGVDVAILNGRGSDGASKTNPGDQEFKEAGLKLQAALVSMGYKSNVGEAGKNKVVIFRTNLGGNHYNHLHISNRIYNGENWSPGAKSKEKSKEESNVLQYGDSGEAVTKLQNQLAVLYTTAPLGTSGIDGKFGPKTRDLLKKYQREHGLPASGKLTAVTKAELEKIDMSAEDAVADLKQKSIPKTGPIAPTDPAAGSISTQKIDTQGPQTISQLPLLRYGSSGPDVKNVQLKLINLYGDKILPKHGADGKFKSETQTAVKKFQRDNKLTVDGIVGQNTYKTLYKYFPTVTVKSKQDMGSDTNNDLAIDELKEIIQQWPLYGKILKEETQRARILMFEYNEEEIWNTMSDPEKSQALMSADDDMGPDFADEFTDTPWLKIPDVITNRIDLRAYAKQDAEKLSRQDFKSKDMDMRGMSYQSKEDDAYKRFIEAYLKKQNIQIDYSQSRPLYKALNQLSKDQVRDLFFKAHDFRSAMSKFVPPTPEEEADSVNNMANIINQDRIDNPGFSRD